MNARISVVLCAVLVALAACPTWSQEAGSKAFPDAQGWAACTPGGRGGRIIRVTNLDPDGPGSLAQAIRAEGPRIVVFEVGGLIDLKGKSLSVSQPFVTIAGQTAPSPGITLIRGGLGISTHDVILQHIRVRPGEAGRAKKSGWEVDAIATSGANAYNIIVDHCSCSWATDENLTASGPRFDGDNVEQWRRGTSRRITFSNCIVAEGLDRSTHAKGRHSKGSLIHDNATNIAIIGNLYAHNHNRNPFFKGGVRGVIVNNVIYNPSGLAAHYALVPSEWGARPYVTGQIAVVGNVLKIGPSTRQGMPLFYCGRGGPCEVLLDDNRITGPGSDKSSMFQVERGAAPGLCRVVDTPPLWPPDLVALPVADVEDHVLANAGAWPWDRDVVDRRIVDEARRGGGHIIDSEQEVGGYPRVAPTRAPFDPAQWNLDDMTRRQSSDRLRVIIETDAPGGDPDDEGSLVRFFLYLNEWDVEGLIGTRAAAHSRLQTSGKDRILQYIDGYEAAYENLSIHAPGYPKPDNLRRITKQCYAGTEGRDHVIAMIDRDDPRPIWYLNWGTNEEDDIPTALRQALDHVKHTRTDAEYQRFAAKLRYVEVYKQNHIGPHRSALAYYLDTFWPDMDGGRWYHRWRPLTQHAGGFNVERDIKTNHGPLCANYTIQKEGDTPTFTHLIPNGLNVPGRPEWGSWAGRYSFNHDLNAWWCDQRDTWQGTTHRDNTLKPWTAHIQNDFKARADWCVAPTFTQANHPPQPHLQNDPSQDVISVSAPAGTTVSLTATGSTDPDADNLTYTWRHYPEPGTYEGSVALGSADKDTCSVRVPANATGKTIHIILQATDDGDPPLTRYRRAVLTATPHP